MEEEGLFHSNTSETGWALFPKSLRKIYAIQAGEDSVEEAAQGPGNPCQRWAAARDEEHLEGGGSSHQGSGS